MKISLLLQHGKEEMKMHKHKMTYTACAGKNGTTALFTVSFSYLHYNVIQRAISG